MVKLLQRAGKLLRRNGKLATSVSKNCCCGGLCPCCANPPQTLIATMPKLSTWPEVIQAIEPYAPGDFEKYMCGYPPYHFNPGLAYLCWPVWAPAGGCALCDVMSQAEVTLVQKPTHAGANCNGVETICDGFGCAPTQAPCQWVNQRMLCVQELGFHDHVTANCCGHRWEVGPPSFPGGAPYNGPHPCFGFNPDDWCQFGGGPDPNFDPSIYETFCNCNDCCFFDGQSYHQGVSTCGGGCCHMAYRLTASITCNDPNFYLVSLSVNQFRAWQVGSAEAISVTGSKTIAAEDWDCLATEIEFYCDEIDTTISGVGSIGAFPLGIFCPYFMTQHPDGCLYDEFANCGDCADPVFKLRRGT